VHARNAVLHGLSPKDNRSVPPLRYDAAWRIAQDFADAVWVLNGGLTDAASTLAQAARFDGVMLGRAAWHTPRVLAELSRHGWPQDPMLSDEALIDALSTYATRSLAAGVPLRVLVRPLLGLANGRTGARRWRQMLSDPQCLSSNDPALIRMAWQQVGSLGQGGRDHDAD